MNPVDSLIKFSGFEGWAVIPVVGLLLWIYFQYLKVKYAGYLRATGKRLDQVLVSKGDRGEFRIYHELVKHRMPGEILLNVYLPKPDGETTEVDLIHLTTHGIFVIESKNYSGWIYGSEHQWNWTQTFRNGHKEKFFNPIKQNHGHVLALLEITQLSIEVFRPLVVFGAKATLKKITVNSSDYPVITIHQLIKEIKNQLSTGPELLPPGQISELKIKLEQFCRADEQTRQRHIEQTNRKLMRKHKRTINRPIRNDSQIQSRRAIKVSEAPGVKFKGFRVWPHLRNEWRFFRSAEVAGLAEKAAVRPLEHWVHMQINGSPALSLIKQP